MINEIESMDDKEFIWYCEIHCETPRALFSGDQINRMIKLAHLDIVYPRNEWFTMRESMRKLCELAREHLGE